MHIELRPLGVKCNIGCTYCYQAELRKQAGNRQTYDIDAMIRTLEEKRANSFTLFGGEPLLLPLEDLERLLSWGHTSFGGSGIQTNGTLIEDAHIALFVKYNVAVGISVDGPGDLNLARWAGSYKRTSDTTIKTMEAITRLLSYGVSVSVIVTLTRLNAGDSRLPHLAEWLVQLDRAGIRRARIHLLETESSEVRDELALTPDENIRALDSLEELEHSRLKNLRFDIFREVEDLLQSNDENVSCVWRACDPYTTEAVQGVDGDGQSTNCGRTNKVGVEFLKAAIPSYERYLSLYFTSYVDGGCQGCRFFLICKGQCPGTALDNDWRNRTEHCGVWLEVFKRAEARLIDRGVCPISKHPDRSRLEALMLRNWASGQNPSLAKLSAQMAVATNQPSVRES